MRLLHIVSGKKSMRMARTKSLGWYVLKAQNKSIVLKWGYQDNFKPVFFSKRFGAHKNTRKQTLTIKTKLSNTKQQRQQFFARTNFYKGESCLFCFLVPFVNAKSFCTKK